MRLLAIFVGLGVVFLIPFFLWEEAFQFSEEAIVSSLSRYGTWAWLAGLVLLVGDLVLPIPATVVMSALGYLYGALVGGILSAIGSACAGLVGYGLCRLLGRRAARWMAGEEDLAKGEQLFARFGGWIVALSRWLPLFPEVIACMAGLARMRAGVFVLAILCGSVPMGMTFAAIGSAGVDHPMLALGLSALLPPILWLAVQRLMKARMNLPTSAECDSQQKPTSDPTTSNP